MAMVEQLLEPGETFLGYLEGGRGETPFLFLHGIGRSGRDFASVFPSLESEFRLFALDARGHGRSGRVPGGYGVRDHARDGVNLIKHLGRPAIVFGHSMGALTAMALAISRPDLVSALILEDPPGVGFLADLPNRPQRAMFEAMASLAGSTKSVPELARELAAVKLPSAPGQAETTLGQVRDAASLRLSARLLRDVDPNVYQPLLEGRWLQGLDFPESFSQISCPCLLLVGETKWGGMLPEPEAVDWAARIPDCLLVRFPQTGHLIHWTAWPACQAALFSFLQSLDLPK